MKKSLLLPVLVAMLFFSCKKDHYAPATLTAKKYKVTFNVTNFLSKQSALAVRHNLSASDTLTSLNTYFDILHYIVYDDLRNTVKDIVQDSTMSNMGLITDSLPAGTYRISIVAGKKGLAVRDNFFEENDYGYGGNSWQDTFFDSFMITIGTSNISQDVTLRRVIGKLELTVLDNIPVNADSLIVSTAQDAYSQDLFEGVFMLSGYINDRFAVKIPASAKGNPNFTMDMLIGNAAEPISYTITCKATDNSTIVNKTVDNVDVMPNEKTILSGDLFASLNPNSSQQNFTTKIDTGWDSGTVQATFSLRTKKYGNH